MTLLIVHAAVTWCLVGLIWTIQLVHYPLFDFVGEAGFTAYHTRHSSVISFLVGPLMLLELVTAGWLVLHPPPSVSATPCWIGFALVLVIWASTAFVSVPIHARLGSGFDSGLVSTLVGTNWIRTVAWTARGVLILTILLRALA
ncbi:hypothetical protein [Deinococcus yavapaiensis]|uniref:hypothetical protein n=1 Tax=Deinococcus yavapaiensis TaxID=309889 RepID=UPI000DA20E24|nr:hypothetical protein [Deinococcus yavapaiensis]